jgi:flavin-dependent dehydrogenase
MYDAIIVGARCAGSPTAMLLARAGHRVLVLDRASFPSDTLSTHFIQSPGMARLAKWGLLESVFATGCPPIKMGLLTIDDQAAEAEFALPEGVPGLAAPRRTVLDKVLADAAVESGAELRQGAMVDSLLVEGDRVVGVQGHDSNGTFEERARFVIGADGRNSMVARGVHSTLHLYDPVPGAGFYSYWADVDCTRAELYAHAEGFTVAFPTNDELTTIAMVFPEERFATMRKDSENEVLAWLDKLGTLGERVRAGRRAHELIPVVNVVNLLRQPWGPGWVLVGDAAYLKDPTPADGISDAWRGADFAADAVHKVLSGDVTEEDALERYRTQLEEFSIPLLEKTQAMTDFDKTAVERATVFFEIQALHEQEVANMQSAAGVSS